MDHLKQFSVIIIDDDKLVQRLVYDVLLRLGFGEVIKASNGAQAISMLEAKPADFIICDWRMPDMDGLEFIRLVRMAATGINPLTPIIMLTGNAEVHHVLQARDVGANEYLTKPFTVKELCRRMIEIVDRPREFVIAKNFKGPSRRRKNKLAAASERRKNQGRSVKVGYDRRK